MDVCMYICFTVQSLLNCYNGTEYKLYCAKKLLEKVKIPQKQTDALLKHIKVYHTFS